MSSPTPIAVSSSKNQARAISLGLAAVLCWATVATAFKLALNGLTPRQLVTVATAVSVVIFAGVISWQERWSAVGKACRRAPGHYLLLGLLNPASYYWVLFMAYDRLPAQQAQAINYSWAITYSLLAIPILGQRLSRRELFAMVVAYGGVVLIATGGVWNGEETNVIGVLLALASTFMWATYWLINTRNMDEPVIALFLCFVVGFVALLATNLIWPEPWEAAWPDYLAAVYVGVFEMGVTFLLWLHALRHAERTAAVSALIFLSPLLSLVLIYFVLHEPIQLSTIAGLAAILIGLYLQRQKS